MYSMTARMRLDCVFEAEHQIDGVGFNIYVITQGTGLKLPFYLGWKASPLRCTCVYEGI